MLKSCASRNTHNFHGIMHGEFALFDLYHQLNPVFITHGNLTGMKVTWGLKVCTKFMKLHSNIQTSINLKYDSSFIHNNDTMWGAHCCAEYYGIGEINLVTRTTFWRLVWKFLSRSSNPYIFEEATKSRNLFLIIRFWKKEDIMLISWRIVNVNCWKNSWW